VTGLGLVATGGCEGAGFVSICEAEREGFERSD
jgi:hypothetical protein